MLTDEKRDPKTSGCGSSMEKGGEREEAKKFLGQYVPSWDKAFFDGELRKKVSFKKLGRREGNGEGTER